MKNLAPDKSLLYGQFLKVRRSVTEKFTLTPIDCIYTSNTRCSLKFYLLYKLLVLKTEPPIIIFIAEN